MDLSIPPVYTQIAEDNESESILEIPWGINSGYWDEGKFQSRFMFYQTYHNKKMAIGSVSRARTEYFEFFPEDMMPFTSTNINSNFGKDWSSDLVVIHKNYLTKLDLENYSNYFKQLGFSKTFEDASEILFKK